MMRKHCLLCNWHGSGHCANGQMPVVSRGSYSSRLQRTQRETSKWILRSISYVWVGMGESCLLVFTKMAVSRMVLQGSDMWSQATAASIPWPSKSESWKWSPAILWFIQVYESPGCWKELVWLKHGSGENGYKMNHIEIMLWTFRSALVAWIYTGQPVLLFLFVCLFLFV